MHLTFGEANSEFAIARLSLVPPMRLFATHLRAGREGEHDLYRAQEMRAILDMLRASNEIPHLLVGDLNTVSPADSVGTPPANAEVVDRGPGTSLLTRAVIPLLLEAGYVDCYRRRHPAEPGYTYQPPEPWLRLDYILTSPQLTGWMQTPRLLPIISPSGPNFVRGRDCVLCQGNRVSFFKRFSKNIYAVGGAKLLH
jgi:exonuclease III